MMFFAENEDDIIGLVILVLIVIGVIYFAYRRSIAKKLENFEERDN